MSSINIQLLQHLHSIAHSLKNRGLYSFAAQVGQIAEEYSQKMTDPRFRAILDEVRNAFKVAAQSEYSSGINAENLSEILSVVDALEKTKLVPKKERYFAPNQRENVVVVPDEVYTTAYNLASVIVNIRQIVKELESANPEKEAKLRWELKELQEREKINKEQAEEIKNKYPEDYRYLAKLVENKINNAPEELILLPESRAGK